MKEINFSYEMTLQFSKEVERHIFTLACTPEETERQKILSRTLKVQGYNEDGGWDILPMPHLSRDTDAYGNCLYYGRMEKPHSSFRISVEGQAETGLAYQEEREEYTPTTARYRYMTELTRLGPTLEAFYLKFLDNFEGTPYEKAVWLTHHLRDYMTYQKGSTTINTPAEEAFARGEGVCQDFSHVMLTLLKMSGIPCRYVSGMLEGDGESHAWVEAYLYGYWYGMDPTNGLLVYDHHLRMAVGRDSRDCPLCNGVFKGKVEQTQTVHVHVWEKEQTKEQIQNDNDSGYTTAAGRGKTSHPETQIVPPQ